MPTLREKIDAARADANRGAAPAAARSNVRSQNLTSRETQPTAAEIAAARVRQNQAAASRHAAMSRGLPLSTGMYHNTALYVALLIAEFIWILLYLLNAFSTAWGSQPAINGFFEGLNRLIVLVDPTSVIVRAAWISWSIGFAFAVASTFLEMHLWKSGSRLLFYLLGVPVMFWDHFTASQMVNMFFRGELYAATAGQNFWAVVGGDIIAITPEPMLVITTATLIAVTRARRGR